MRIIKSNRGFIFTFEAIIIAFFVLIIFILIYGSLSHNFQSNLEEKKEIESYHKALYLKDYYIKKYSFPGLYKEEYLTNFANNLNLEEKTFDPINNISGFLFVIENNSYDEALEGNINLGYIRLNYTKLYSNVNRDFNYSPLTTKSFIMFKENLYIPKITGMENNNTFNLYGGEGDHIYFKVNSEITDVEAKLINNNGEVILKINGYILNTSLNSSYKSLDKSFFKTGINKIEVLKAPSVVEFSVKTQNTGEVYYLTLSPRNVIFKIPIS